METSVEEGEVMEEAGWVAGKEGDPFDWLSFLKKGFLVSVLYEDEGTGTGAEGGLEAASCGIGGG